MRILFRAGVAAAVATTLLTSVAQAQADRSEELLRRVDSLQARVAQLEQRVGELEALLKATGSRKPATVATGNSRDIENWRRLRQSMTMDDVRSILGEPQRIDGGGVAFWHYPRDGRVAFVSGRVSSWSEPDR